MKRRFTAALLLASCASAPSSADIQGFLTFRDPTGTATASESIPVWVTLTLSESSDRLNFNSEGPLFGLPESWIPTHGDAYINGVYVPNVPFATIDYASIAGSITCGSFNEGCANSPYRYDYGQSTVLGLAELSMAPGESRDFLFNHLAPNPSPAAPGTYFESSFSLRFAFYGVDDERNPVSTIDYAVGFSTDGAASFTRTISAVPEPSAYVMLLAGLCVLLPFARRRNTSDVQPAISAGAAAHAG